MGFSFVWPTMVLIAVAQVQVVAQVQIAPTDRLPFAAQVLAISDDAVEVAEGNQLSQIATDKLRWIRFADSNVSPTPPAEIAAGGRQAALADGSTFTYRSFTLSDGKAQFELAAGSSMALPASNLHRVQLQSLTEPQLVQWQAITQSRTTADVLVLIRSPEALEKLEGVVSQVTSAAVRFDFGGQAIDAPLAKLAGIRFFSATAPNAAAPNATAPSAKQPTSAALTGIVADQSGGRWLAAHIEMARGGANLELTLQCGVKLTLPLEQLCEIDFSAGSMQFLAELEPLARRSTGRFELGIDIPGADELFGARANDLRQPGSAGLGPSLEFLGSGSVEYRIPADFTRLVGAVELRPSGSRYTPCQVAVTLDNQGLWQQRLAETGKLWPIDVEVKSDGRLRIEVAADAPLPVGDVVLWHDLRFVK